MNYRNLSLIAALGVSLPWQSANAQTSVTLYGLISAGIAYSPNQSGHQIFQAISGQNQTPRWGLRGTEDLGGGSRALFVLEAGFNVVNGTAGQNGRAFGRQSYIGLANDDWGAVMLGRQYDSVVDFLGPNTAYSWLGSIGDSDNTFNNIRIQHSIKYTTPQFGGFRANALYGFSNDPGGFTNNRAYSLGVKYESGPVVWNAAFAQYDSPFSSTNTSGAVDNDYSSSSLIFTKSALPTQAYASRQRIIGTGGFYVSGPLRLGALFTNVDYDYRDQSHLNLKNFNVSVNYNLRPDVVLGAAYIFTHGNYDRPDNSPMWHELHIAVDYLLSKRTDIGLLAFFQQAAGDATHANVLGYRAASGKRQAIWTVGVRHKF